MPLGASTIKLSRSVTNSASTGNTKGGSITIPLTSCLTGLDKSVWQIKTNLSVVDDTADSKPAKQEVNSTVILSTLVFPDLGLREMALLMKMLEHADQPL